MEKKTAKEILEIIEKYYRESDFAYNEWGNWKRPKDFRFSDKTNEIEQTKHEADIAFMNHPGYPYNQVELRDEEYNRLYKIWNDLPSPYEFQEKEILNYLGLGEIEEVDQYGGEGQGDDWWSIKHFKDHDIYIQIDGWYTSHEGTEFHNGYGHEVWPKEVKKIEFSSKKD